MGKRHDTRTLRAEPAAPRVEDPATRDIFLALARALAMGLDSPRARELAIAAIARGCGPVEEVAPQKG